MFMFIDVHTHLDSKQFLNDIDDVIKRAVDSGIKVIINNGGGVESNRKTLELSEKYEIVQPALGLDPNELIGEDEAVIEEEAEFILKSNPCAIGEVGLDFFRQGEKEKQKEIFLRAIEVAEKLSRPLIVHSRGAEKEVVETLQNCKVDVVLHCFQGSEELIKQAEDNGWYFSIPPIILRDMNFQKLVSDVAISNLLTETDSPYLAPPPKKRNEPMNVVKVVEKISEIKDLDLDEVKKNIFMNYQKVFLK